MISFDHSMVLQEREVTSDTRERHLKYASGLKHDYPDGHLTVLVKAPVSMSSQAVKLSEALTVYPVPSRRGTFVINARRTAKFLLEKGRFDVVTTQTPFDDGWLGTWLKRHFGIPLNVQMRSSFLDFPNWFRQRPIVYRVFNALGKWVSRRADTIRVVSHGEKQRLEQKFPGLRGKIFVLHPLINVYTFHEPVRPDEQEHVRNVLQQSGMAERPFLLFVGRLVIEKNLSTLLPAFAEVCRNMPKACLVMAGDGPLRADLEHMAKQFQLEKNIIWLGGVTLNALRGWYALATGMMLPSLQEGVPRVLLESYLMETPAIITPFVSAKELVQDGRTGFITRSFVDPKELAEKMLILLRSGELAKEMGKQGRRLAENYLCDEATYMKRLIGIWKNTAG